MTAETRRLPYLDDLATGDAIPEIAYEVTQDLIDAYGLASLDLNPVHMDPGWSSRARVFGTPETVAHGMMSMSFMTSLVYRAFGALADITTVDSKFTKPVPVGSIVTIRGTIRDVHPLRNGEDFAVVSVDAIDQDGDTIGVSEIHVRLPRRPGARP